MSRCAWCLEDRPLVTVMVFSDCASVIEHVCAACRKKWLRQLRKECGVK